MKTLILILLTSVAFGQTDKDGSGKHFYSCAAISIGVSELTYQTTNLQGLSPWIGALAGIGANEFKENIWDGKMGRGSKTLNDRIVGAMGAVTGAFIHRALIDVRYRKEQKEFIKLTNAKRITE